MYKYVALGDSITAGYSATTPAFAYPSRLVKLLSGRFKTTCADVLAEPGWTSKNLEEAVFTNPATPLTAANGISIWVGGDDLIHAAFASLQRGSIAAARTIMPMTLRGYGRDVGTLVKGIQKVSRSRIVLCTQYNPFPNSPVAGEAIASLNAVTEEVAAATGCVLAPVHEWFSGNQAALIAGYRTGRIEDALRGSAPIHPNNQGHAVIAANLAPLLS